ncbi:MAG: hypothetical protein ACQKHC_01960 [Candidatus Phytoplasma pruni]|uniref:hypothetical protein n=1 Tax=Milkweed yellows phytoplasma TaxID=208434 RepID=UPI0004B1D4DE|nr:hypothetical protein [Milkweed yellows phytoplasma]
MYNYSSVMMMVFIFLAALTVLSLAVLFVILFYKWGYSYAINRKSIVLPLILTFLLGGIIWFLIGYMVGINRKMPPKT